MRKIHNKLSGRTILWACLLLALSALWFFRHLIYTSYTLAALPFIWHKHASDFIISPKRDNFDLTLTNYSVNQLSAEPYSDVVPPVLHHFAFGREGSHQRSKWEEAVQSCLKWHPGWESHLWTDKTASDFVAQRFPELKDMWDNYPYLIERIDALRYMVLYEYGGVILDMDLKCKRSLGPLRRFEFVAPAAHPTGFSIGFMMASRHNTFVRDIVRSLKAYNKKWLGLPYSSVMFSTGCHFASTIHAFQPNRTNLKILPGPLHSLNGHVSTPLFDHLGSSSWHSYDAALIVKLGRSGRAVKFVCLAVFLALAIVVGRRVSWLRRLVARLARQANGLRMDSTK